MFEKLEIRLATTADIARIASITNSAFAIEKFIEGTRTDEAGVGAMMQKGVFLVAAKNSQILASIYIELRGDRGYFGMLAVDPSQQGQGLARIMIQAAEDYCRDQGCKVMDITVLSLRPELLPFYRKQGYMETGTEEFHPSRPLRAGAACHCVTMSKAL